MRHELKTRLEPFKSAWAGSKPFEIRLNDRNFQIDDEIVLQEYNHHLTEAQGAYTGREIEGFITYVTTFAQQPGYCVFGYRENYRIDQ